MATLTPAERKRLAIKPPAIAEDDPAFSVESNAPPATVDGISGQRLLSFIERIERLREEVKALQTDIKEIKSEAKGTGFEVKVLNYLVKIRAEDKDDRDEFDTLVEAYARAIGMPL